MGVGMLSAFTPVYLNYGYEEISMEKAKPTNKPTFNPIEDPVLANALNELGRSINLITTYGKNHPAAKTAMEGTFQAMQALFSERKKLTIGTFNGVLLLDEQTVQTVGTLQKSLERRLMRLNITGLRLVRGISQRELTQLTELLASNDADTFQNDFCKSNLSHIESANARLQAVHEGQTVANESDLAGGAGDGVLVLEDDGVEEGGQRGGGNNLQVEQIVAFLKGEVDAENSDVGEELTELSSDPDRLGRMIMESVAIRQSVSELAGESLNDIVLGCLRRTYDGLRKQSAFQTTEGKTELKKALLLLEESVLEKMRGLAGEEDPEMDRQIVQAIREMDDHLGFEIAAAQYMEHQEAMQENKAQLQRFVEAQGANVAETLLAETGFPGNDWRKIVVESGRNGSRDGGGPLSSGLNTLATVFEKLEQLMKSETADGKQVKDLLGQVNDNLDDTIDTTREKLAVLSSTIGGHAHTMSRDELLVALSEVAQELMQPLTAINASLEMMLHGYVGKITADQQDLLTLASNSGEHLKFLMNMLIEIVGCPINKGIDSRFHTTSEQVVLMKDEEAQGSLSLGFL